MRAIAIGVAARRTRGASGNDGGRIESLEEFSVRIESLEERVLNLENSSQKTLSNLMGKLQQLDVEMDQAVSVRGLSGEQWLLPRRKALLARIETLTQQVARAAVTSFAGAAQQPEPKPQGVNGMPCIAATAASPGRGAQPDAGVDAALGSAFNASGRSNDDVCGSPPADRGTMGDGGGSGGGSSTSGLNRTQTRRTVESAEVLDSFSVRIESLEERVLNLENPSRKTLSNLMGKLQQLDVEMDQAVSVRGLSGEQWLLPRRKALLARIETLTQQVARAAVTSSAGAAQLPEPKPQGVSGSAAFLRTVMPSRRAGGAPAWLPPSTPVEDVPGCGACLFHAIAQSSDASTARSLRHLTVDWVRAHWTENPDVLPLLGTCC
eukprot:COSAG01_NODE_5664_length_4112_cov_8.551458_3_plen_379_part_00